MIRRSAGGDTFLRVIAAERAARGVVLLVAGVYLVGHTGADFGSTANRFARSIEVDPQRPWVRHLIARLGELHHHEILVFGIGALGYGALELVEGVGLWLRQAGPNG